MKPLVDSYTSSLVLINRKFPIVKKASEFDYYRCLEFHSGYYNKTINTLHAGNLRDSKK